MGLLGGLVEGVVSTMESDAARIAAIMRAFEKSGRPEFEIAFIRRMPGTSDGYGAMWGVCFQDEDEMFQDITAGERAKIIERGWAWSSSAWSSSVGHYDIVRAELSDLLTDLEQVMRRLGSPVEGVL